MAEEARSRLGRGLAALMGDVGDEAVTADKPRGQRRVPIEFLHPNPRNPRRNFSEAELDELAASIRERGVIQPIVVRDKRGAKDQFEIIAGERRWRASQRAGLHEVPIVPLDVNDNEALEIAIIENVQRADLDPIEEASGYQRLVDEFKYSQDTIAKMVGKSRPHVANTVRLLKLPEPVWAYLHDGKLTAGHARMLVGHPDAGQLADQIVTRGLNVRQVEDLIRAGSKKPARTSRPPPPAGKDADTAALEKRLSDLLGLAVSIDNRGEAGTLQISYRSLDQLEEVLRRLEQG
jgi:ParB family chromosome partitioning protein